MNQTALDPAIATTGDDDNYFHVYCSACDPEGSTALCGKDISDVPESDGDDEEICKYCDYLMDFPCPTCGAP